MPITTTFGGLGAFGFGVFPGGALESIATVTVGSGGAASITFSDIPQSFQHLHCRLLTRGTASDYFGNISVYFNSDTGNNYGRHTLFGDGTGAGAAGVASTTYIYNVRTGASAPSSVFSVGIVDVLDYTNTSKNTTLRSFNGFDNNGNGTANADKGVVGVSSGVWLNTNAVTAIQFAPVSGNFAQYSTAALYGVRAA